MTLIQKGVGGLLIPFLAVAFFLSRPAYAHYLWVAAESDRYIVARGAPPDGREAYNPEAVKLITVLDRGGTEVSMERVDEKTGVFFRSQQPVSVAAVMCAWGSRVKTTRGKRLMTRKEAEAQGLKVLEAFTSTQISKTLLADGDAVLKNLGMRFEIVPLKSPFQLKPGAALEVQLFFDGAPLKDAVVSMGEATQAKTDEKGVVRLDGLKGGYNIIMARRTLPGSGDIDYHQFMTFLVFRIP